MEGLERLEDTSEPDYWENLRDWGYQGIWS